MFNSLEKSLKRLRREFIDIYQIHWPPPYNDLEDICFALQKAIKQGKIRSVGVSNFLENDILLAKEILKDDLFSHQVELNPFNRSYETDFKLLHHKNNIRTLGYTPLKGLVNLKRNTEKYKLLFFLSCKYKKSINQIILNWLLSLGKNLSLIISTGNLDHLKQNVYLENFSLSKEDILKINNIFKSKIQFIEISKINLSLNTTYEIYQNINEALDNISGYSPSPKELSIEFMKNKKCKPIKLLKKNNNYYLTGGMIRFWAWVIAFNNSINIPSIVEEI